MEKIIKSCNIYDVRTSIITNGPDAGQTQILVKFPECNLKCLKCGNLPDKEIDSCRYEGIPGSKEYYYVSTPVFYIDLANVIINYCDFKNLHHAIRLCGGEPLMFSSYISLLSGNLKDLNVPVKLVTNGSLPHELAKVIDSLDIVQINYRLEIIDGIAPYIDKLKKCLEIIRQAEKKAEVVIRISKELLESEVREVAVAIHEIDPEIPLYLEPCDSNLSIRKTSRITPAKIMRLINAACYKLPHVFLIPDFKPLLTDENSIQEI
jgi:pyruvate-formate lyase-activating enzyme